MKIFSTKQLVRTLAILALSKSAALFGIDDCSPETEKTYVDNQSSETKNTCADDSSPEIEKIYTDARTPEMEKPYVDSHTLNTEKTYADEQFSETQTLYIDARSPETEHIYTDTWSHEIERTYASDPYAYEDCFDRCGFVFAEFGYQAFRNLPTFSYGGEGPDDEFVPASFFTFDDDQPDTVYVRFGFGFDIPSCFTPCWLGHETYISAEAFVSADTLTNSIFVPDGDTLVFLPLIDGSNSESIPQNPSYGNSKREYYYKGVELTLASIYPLRTCGWCFSAEPYLALGLEQFEQNYGLVYNVPGFFGPDPFLFDLNEQLRTNYCDLGGGIEVEAPIWGSFSGFINAGGYVSFAHASFHGHQRMAFDTDTFSFADVHDHVNTTSGKFKGSVGIETHCKGINIGVIGRYEYWGYLPEVINYQPFGVNAFPPEPVRLGDAFFSTYSVGLYGTVNF